MTWSKIFVVLLGLLSFSFLSNFDKKPGAVILVGGGEIPEKALNWLVERASPGNFLVITSDPEYSHEKWATLLGPNISCILPEDLTWHNLNGIAAIIIDGGDQWDYLTKLDGKLIQKAHEDGITILGTSAGAMILGQYYFSAKEGTITSEQAEAEEHLCLGSNYACIQYLRGMIVDTHFRERDRWGRLDIFVKKCGAICGLGIDEGTAICLDEKGFTITGEGDVSLLTFRP